MEKRIKGKQEKGKNEWIVKKMLTELFILKEIGKKAQICSINLFLRKSKTKLNN